MKQFISVLHQRNFSRMVTNFVCHIRNLCFEVSINLQKNEIKKWTSFSFIIVYSFKRKKACIVLKLTHSLTNYLVRVNIYDRRSLFNCRCGFVSNWVFRNIRATLNYNNIVEFSMHCILNLSH